MVRSGYHPEREIVTGVGKVNVSVPKIRNRAGEPESFLSMVVPPYIRRTATLNAAIPWHLQRSDAGTLEAIAGPEAKGLCRMLLAVVKCNV